MSINKNAYLRYQILDKCFSNKYKIYFIEDLLDEVNKALEDFNGSGSKIERRQLFDDIKFMESEAGWSIPLERIKDGKKVKYRYSEDNFSIKNQKISDEELDAINAALMVLLRFRGLPQFEWINELKKLIEITEEELIDYLPDELPSKWIPEEVISYPIRAIDINGIALAGENYDEIIELDQLMQKI